VWLDGEEAVRQWSETDSLYGSRHLAEKWQKDGTISQLKAFLLADMIGDADLNIDRDQNSTAWLEDLVYEAAGKLGYQSHFFARTTAVEDDHLPGGRGRPRSGLPWSGTTYSRSSRPRNPGRSTTTASSRRSAPTSLPSTTSSIGWESATAG